MLDGANPSSAIGQRGAEARVRDGPCRRRDASPAAAVDVVGDEETAFAGGGGEDGSGGAGAGVEADASPSNRRS